MAQTFGFQLMESLLAEVAGVRQYDLHTNIDAMIAAAEAIKPIAERLGVPPPPPHLSGFSYPHVSALGCEVIFPPQNPEPWVAPIIRTPGDIDRLREPEDYLSAGVVPARLALAAGLKERCPTARGGIGHGCEGPVTTAALLMGQDFFMLPYDDPTRAHRLLDFCVTSAMNYMGRLRALDGLPDEPRGVGIPDDFAGLFPPDLFAEFALPYLQRLYAGQQASSRALHCELLHVEHLPFLAELGITSYDPGVNQYLDHHALAAHCPVPFSFRIWPAQVIAMPAKALVALYRDIATVKPRHITFELSRLADLHKAEALLAVARELQA